jgi:hypothetical protein
MASQLYQSRGVTQSDGRRRSVSLSEFMLTLLESIAFLILVAVSLGGFAAAMTWMFAVWFGERS